LTTERNTPCPCGSGKKYKKCCAADAVKADNVRVNRLIAYQGQIGQLREAFCQAYIATKKAATQNIEHGLVRDADAAGQTISCRKGCGECCTTYYIAASLQECEAIVYWLYQHEDVLRHFLRAAASWRTKVSGASHCFDTINHLYGKIVLSQATEEEKQTFREAMDDYEGQHIACPALVDGACSIYEVRPYVCACVVSASPPEWCHLSHPDHSRMNFIKTELPLAKDMSYFVRPKSGIIFASMPLLVSDILNGGYAALAAVPGLEALQQTVFSDPAVQSVLRQSQI